MSILLRKNQRQTGLVGLILSMSICALLGDALAKPVFQSPLNTLAEKAQPMKTLADFHPQLFWNRPPEGFYDIDLGIVDKDHAGLKLLAIADVDSDGFADLITVNAQEDTFQVHFYDPTARTFAAISQQVYVGGGKISSIVPARNQELLQSLYVIYDKSEGGAGTFIGVYKQVKKGEFRESLRSTVNGWRLPLHSQPMFLDINGDMKTDILLPDEKNHIWVYVAKDFVAERFEKRNFTDFLVEDENCTLPDPDSYISTPHSNSFLDLNGDCMPDIFLQKTVPYASGKGYQNYYEIYTQKQVGTEQKYCLHRSNANKHMIEAGQRRPLTDPAQAVPLVEFADVDSDGMLDMFFYHEGRVYVYYNQLPRKPYTNGLGASYLCYKQDEASTDAVFYDYDSLSQVAIDHGGNEHVVIQDLSAHFDKPITGIVPSLGAFPNRGRVRSADVNIDGFPDLFLTLQFQGKAPESLVLLNARCTEKTCTREATLHKKYNLDLPRRFFEVSYLDGSFGSDKITKLAGSSAVLLVPVDIDDDGRIDMLVQRCESKSGQEFCNITLIYNNVIFDSFFLKAMMLAQTNSDQEDLGQKMFGANIAGVTFRYIVTTLDDQKYVRVATHAPQSSYNALELPYSHNGIGRSNNYLESFNVAYSRLGQPQVRVFTPIIPNSQLIITANDLDAKSWNLDLFVSPMEYLIVIVFAASAVLVVSGAVIIIMHWQEKKEDNKNRLQIDF